jgi:hypothetical protein
MRLEDLSRASHGVSFNPTDRARLALALPGKQRALYKVSD